MLKAWGWSWRRSLSLFVESACPLCQRSTPQTFCLDCHRQLQRCQVAPIGWSKAGDLSVFSWGHYEGGLKRAIAQLKYHNQPHLAEPLGQWMAQAWQQTNRGTGAIVVPIPMHDHKKQQRGFNQAELLAKNFCALTRLPLEVNGLERIRATEAQFGLSQSERQQNLKDAFCLGPSFLNRRPTKPVLLLDDIYTTGTTVQSAAQTLQKQGIQVQGVVVLAKTGFEKKEGKRMRDEG